MAHATHFLSRLSRLQEQQIDLALELYRDPVLVRELLGKLQLAEGPAQVALSLAVQDRGPWIVVSRSGAFITCLGPGMEPYDAVQVEYHELQAQIQRIRWIRELLDRITEVQRNQKLELLFGALYHKAHRFSREDALTLLPLMPLVGTRLFSSAFRSFVHQLKQGGLLERNVDRHGKQIERDLRAYWRDRWSICHKLLLVATGDREYAHSLAPSLIEYGNTFTSPMWWEGDTATAILGAWIVGYLGKPFLPQYKQLLLQPGSLYEWLEGLVGVLALGLRHAKLAEETTQLLLGPPAWENSILAQDGELYRSNLLPWLELAIDKPGSSRTWLVEQGRKRLLKHAASGCLQPPYCYTDQQEIPEELAFAFFLQDAQVPLLTEAGLALLILGTAAVANASLADLYLPRDFLDHIQDQDLLARIRRLVRARRLGEDPDTQRPLTKPPTPGRNDPCSCGSGKKFKKCCGQ